VKSLSKPAAVMALTSSGVYLNHFDIYSSALANDPNVKKAVIIQPFVLHQWQEQRRCPILAFVQFQYNPRSMIGVNPFKLMP
jgi:hypothetical protein